VINTIRAGTRKIKTVNRELGKDRRTLGTIKRRWGIGTWDVKIRGHCLAKPRGGGENQRGCPKEWRKTVSFNG